MNDYSFFTLWNSSLSSLLSLIDFFSCVSSVVGVLKFYFVSVECCSEVLTVNGAMVFIVLSFIDALSS